MDRLKQIRDEAGGSGDSTLDTTSLPSEAFMSANESSSKYFSLSDSTFDITPIKDVSLASTTSKIDDTITDPNDLISNLSPIGKKDILEDYKIGKEIEAGSILSGGVNIFDDNESSFDGNELVIDDNVELDDKLAEKPVMKSDDNESQDTLVDSKVDVPSKDTEVVLQIDGRNVDAIDIGNGLYLYRKNGIESPDELAAVQIVDDGENPTFKFLKVRENADGNLEVYEEIEVEVPPKEGAPVENPSHVPIKDINKVISDQSSNKVADKSKSPQKQTSTSSTDVTENKETDKTEFNFNGKMVKFGESRKSPVVGSFTPMTYHSTPNKEGKPLTKTMVDLQLHPNRHSDNVKKTIEVHTDKQKPVEIQAKKLFIDDTALSHTEIPKVDVSVKNINDEAKTSVTEDSKITVHFNEPATDISMNIFDINAQKPIDDTEIPLSVDATDAEQKEKLPMKDPEIAEEKIITEEVEVVSEKELDQKDKSECINKVCEKDQGISSKENVAEENVLVDGSSMVNDGAILISHNDVSVENKPESLSTESKPEELKVEEVESSTSLENKVALVKNDKKICEEKNLTDSQNKTEDIVKEPNVEKIMETTVDNRNTDIMLTDNIDDDDKLVINEEPNKTLTENDVPQDINMGQEKLIIDKKPTVEEINKTSTSNDSPENIPIEQEKIVIDQKPAVDASNKTTTDKLVDEKPTVTIKAIEKTSDSSENIKSTNDPVATKHNWVPKTEIKDNNVEQPKTSETGNLPQAVKQNLVPKSEAKETNISEQINEVDNKEKTITINKKTVSNNVSSSKSDVIDIKTVEKVPNKPETSDKKIPVIKLNLDTKSMNNNHASAVPFGQWTAANRQEFLNKFKDAYKAPVHSNTKQIKNSNDLNRRDVLKKIDSQRQQSNIASAKDKVVGKSETIFSSKLPILKPDVKPVKTSLKKEPSQAIEVKPKVVEPIQTTCKSESKVSVTIATSTMTTCTVSGSNITKTEATSRRQVNVNDLINKTIEDMINNVVSSPPPLPAPLPPPPPPPPRAVPGKSKSNVKKDPDPVPQQVKREEQKTPVNNTAETAGQCIDDIEMKMNELHGIPFVERPPHQLPKVLKTDVKTYSKCDKENPQSKVTKKIETSTVVTNEKTVTENAADVDSEEEVIEHEPVTGDIALNVKPVFSKLPVSQNKKPDQKSVIGALKKEPVITENEFDKFARRNSVTYEDCITVNYDKNESYNTQNIRNITKVTTVKPKHEIISIDPKSKLPHRQSSIRSSIPTNPSSKIVVEDPNNKNYQSKIHLAYQNVLTTKKDRQDRPITIIEDKPVKVVFMDAGTDFVPGQLNVQGKELSPAKKPTIEPVVSDIKPSSNSIEMTELDTSEIDDKQGEDLKSKTKHQRKQVLTPVETPELELITPKDLGLEASPKKKRKTEDTKTDKTDKQSKNLVHKKSYLLGRSTTSDDKPSKPLENSDSSKKMHKDDVNGELPEIKNTSSALDNLVKAAELIEQSGSMSKSASTNSDSSQSTPVKRGRGRPRKYPLPDETADKSPSPQKKPRLIDAKPVKERSISISDTSDDEMVRENWTMGKINENIVCPICNKLFRSENVVFKHVKHCTGVSPNRSESDKRSSRGGRHSQESDLRSLDSRSEDMEIESEDKSNDSRRHIPRKRKTKEPVKEELDKNEIIVIEDTPPVKEKIDDDIKEKKKLSKTNLSNRFNGHICEICGKTFRQLSYLVNHKLQHKKEEPKKIEKPAEVPNKPQVFSCEVCKKEFRKLHHLVQHRIIHNPNVPSRILRNNSVEQTENKAMKDKEQSVVKQSDDSSAAFRCEPCDKSFRKLHHLVEHRETHDGINRQKTVANPPPVVEKPPPPPPPPQCDVCKKTFRKLHHLIEHKEQHIEASTEKPSEKENNEKGALSTKDIIHECSLCYMVFPNEHSLNKHTVNCQRKKRQSKTVKNVGEEISDENDENVDDMEVEDITEPTIIAEEIIDDDDEDDIQPISNLINKEKTEQKKVEEGELIVTEQNTEKPRHAEISTEKETQDIPVKPIQKETPAKVIEPSIAPVKRDLPAKEKSAEKEVPVIPEKMKKIEEKETKVYNTTKKKVPIKDKLASTITKRQKSEDTIQPSPPADIKPSIESSDDDEVRYMLNPDFKLEETEGKTFMKVRATKRNSLQIERPNSKDLMKRRTSLQHPPKIPKLKPKPVEPKVLPTNLSAPKTVHKIPKLEAAPSTDSDDSDVKYSFPKIISEKTTKQDRTAKEPDKKPGRKSIADKRKSLSGIAKRKSLGEAIIAKNKAKPSPVKVIRKRIKEVEHRCDCGQLFNSAALLSRHTSLAHTPPRIRRRRSPPPEVEVPKTTRKSTEKPKPSRKSTDKSEVSTSKPRKSNKPDVTTPETRKSIKPETKTTSKTKRVTPAHRGVPVPEKMRKLMMKMKN